MNLLSLTRLMSFGLSIFALSGVSNAGVCPSKISMPELSDVHKSGFIVFGDQEFEPASPDDLASVLPSSLSPSWKTAQANLREEKKENGFVTCRFGYKSMLGVAGSYIGKKLGASKETMDDAFNYEFVLIEKKSAEKKEESQSAETVAAPSIVVDGKINVAVLLDKDPSMKDLLAILGLANNKSISKLIVKIQYELKKEHNKNFNKNNAETLRIIEDAFERLNKLFL